MEAWSSSLEPLPPHCCDLSRVACFISPSGFTCQQNVTSHTEPASTLFWSQSLMKHGWNPCYDAVLGREKYLGEGSANSRRDIAVTWSGPCVTSYPRVLTQEQQRAVSVRAAAWMCGHRSSHCLGKPCLSRPRLSPAIRAF